MRVTAAIGSCMAFCFSMGAGAQGSNADYLAELKAKGYPQLQMLSYSVTKNVYAITALYKSKEDKSGRIFFANISAEDGKMAFKVARECDASGGLQERTVKVSGQKIQAHWMCVRDSVRPSNSQEVYLLKTAEGNAFAKKEFAEKQYVWVHVDGLPVPFHTEGYAQAVEEASRKAL